MNERLDHAVQKATLQRKIDELFRKSFAESWSVSALELAEDAKQWPTLAESTRKGILRTMAQFSFLERAVTGYLGPLLFAAPHERDAAFLGTQIGDEARHTYLFQRLFNEVFQLPNELGDSRQVAESASSAFFAIFDQHLKQAVEHVSREPANRAAFVRAIVVYHIIVEGFIAHGTQMRLLKFFNTKRVLPGMQRGFENLLRDESRHIAWGVLILQLLLLEEPSLEDTIRQTLNDLAKPLVSAVVAPELIQPAGKLPRLPDWRQDLLEDKLAHRLKVIGLSASTVCEIIATYGEQFEQQWALHKEKHGIEHEGRMRYLKSKA